MVGPLSGSGGTWTGSGARRRSSTVVISAVRQYERQAKPPTRDELWRDEQLTPDTCGLRQGEPLHFDGLVFSRGLDTQGSDDAVGRRGVVEDAHIDRKGTRRWLK